MICGKIFKISLHVCKIVSTNKSFYYCCYLNDSSNLTPTLYPKIYLLKTKQNKRIPFIVSVNRSHVCWHVYGLLHRSDRNYNEAIKAYKQALRIDNDNLQILRDLSMLQIQMRDLSGFVITRHNILNLKSNGKINWLAFALAKHLTGDLRGAISIIDIYLETLPEGSPEKSPGFEASELALYRNRILAEIPNNYGEALSHLSACQNIIVDHTSSLIAKATYQYKLKDFFEAKKTVMDIFARGLIENCKIHFAD